MQNSFKLGRRHAVVFVGLSVLSVFASAGCVVDFTGGCEGTKTCGDIRPSPECIPQEGQAVPAVCGLFVASDGPNDGDGTISKPFQKLAEAITKAQDGGKPIYVCGGLYEESLVVPAGTIIYGGLDCKNEWLWRSDGVKSELTDSEGNVPLTFSGDSKMSRPNVIWGFHIQARTPEVMGGSSIAVIASDVDVQWSYSTIEADNGSPGAAGEAYEDAAGNGAHGLEGGKSDCFAQVIAGGKPVTSSCGTDASFGGMGGVGTISEGGPGSDGWMDPVPDGLEPQRNGGFGGKVSKACSAGGIGVNGAAGESGAAGSGIGAISRTGYEGVSGGDGGAGTTAQGGGGGGGSSPVLCTDTDGFSWYASGAGGGSGGAGGCGGNGGRGGRAGGSSIGIISINASHTFNEVVIRTHDGGMGGAGGKGQKGGTGGDGGSGGFISGDYYACQGGKGGNGGNGGPGGGGAGGHSIGIAYQGTALELMGVEIETGFSGVGGTGGEMGSAGKSEKALAF